MKIKSDSSRLDILEKIRAASNLRPVIVDVQPINKDTIYKSVQPDKVSCFINELEAVNGQCVLCDDDSDLYLKLRDFVDKRNFKELFCRDEYYYSQLEKNEIPVTNKESEFENMQVGITGCECLVARTGSVLVSSFTFFEKQMNVFPPIHIVIAHVSQLVDYLEEALVATQQKYGISLPAVISTITGPSRTADIEKTLVLGAHGPKEFIVFLSKV